MIQLNQDNSPEQVTVSLSSKAAIHELHPADVLCCKDQKSFHHSGNVNFRSLIQQHRAAYHSAKNRPEKSKTIKSIVTIVQNAGGRFLKPDEDGAWAALEYEVLQSKIAHALRKCKAGPFEAAKQKQKKEQKQQQKTQPQLKPQPKAQPEQPRQPLQMKVVQQVQQPMQNVLVLDEPLSSEEAACYKAFLLRQQAFLELFKATCQQTVNSAPSLIPTVSVESVV